LTSDAQLFKTKKGSYFQCKFFIGLYSLELNKEPLEDEDLHH